MTGPSWSGGCRKRPLAAVRSAMGTAPTPVGERRCGSGRARAGCRTGSPRCRCGRPPGRPGGGGRPAAPGRSGGEWPTASSAAPKRCWCAGTESHTTPPGSSRSTQEASAAAVVFDVLEHLERAHHIEAVGGRAVGGVGEHPSGWVEPLDGAAAGAVVGFDAGVRVATRQPGTHRATAHADLEDARPRGELLQLAADEVPAQPRVRGEDRFGHHRRPGAAGGVATTASGVATASASARLFTRRSATRPRRRRPAGPARRRAPRDRRAARAGRGPARSRRCGGVSEVSSAHPTAAPWYTLLGTTRRALGPSPKIPRHTSWPATTPGRSSGSIHSVHVTRPSSPTAARVAARSCPRPTMVQTRGRPGIARRAAPMIGRCPAGGCRARRR